MRRDSLSRALLRFWLANRASHAASRRRWKVSQNGYNEAPGAAWAKPEQDPSGNTTPADVHGLQWHVWHEGAGTSRSVAHDPGRGYFLSEGLVALAPADWSARDK